MKRQLPFAIVLAVLIGATLGGTALYHFSRPPKTQVLAVGTPGAQPAHLRGKSSAAVTLEVFGDFECLPCFILWPALRNLEHDFPSDLAVIFREHPLPQHAHALDAARAAEAAGLQGKFWEMHDMLYLNRAKWVRSSDPRAYFESCAQELRLDLERFRRELTAPAVMQRIDADNQRAASLGIDRTPVVLLNGRRLQLEADVENGIRTEITGEISRRKAERR